MYATDKRGIQNGVALDEIMLEEAEKIKLKAEVSEDGTDINLTATGIRGGRSLQAAVWGEENGQNDLIWYSMPRTLGIKYQKEITAYDHLETGLYHCHLYATEMDGSLRKVAQIEFTIDKLEPNYLRISDLNDKNGTCRATFYLPSAQTEIDGILMAVWTENGGQDDLRWYTAFQRKNGWFIDVNAMRHKCESGNYIFHVYARGKNGTMEGLAKKNIYLTRTVSVDISNVIRTAAEPLGRTLYVWGGGWNVPDNGAGETAVTMGVSPQWENYFNSNRYGYSYKPGMRAWQRGERHWRFYGLDCSGYLGWMLYNSVEKGKNPAGYVTDAAVIAESLTRYGYGSVSACSPGSTFKPGDIISIAGHCFLSLGQCGDGSVVLLHSTPNGGVQVSGTVNGAGSSQASRLAQAFMQQNYPQWWTSFGGEGRQRVSASIYLNGTKFTWSESALVGDSENIRAKSVEEVLKYLK